MPRIFVILLLPLAAPWLRAATFSVEEAAARAVSANADLAAARWGIEEARGRVIQSGRLANPELETEFKRNVRGREMGLSIGFTQKFPHTHRLFHERAVSLAEFAAAEAELRNAERLLRAEVRSAAVRLLAVQAQKAQRETQRRNSAELAADAEKAAKVGEGSPLDAAHFELEEQQFSLELLKADAEAEALRGTLRPLLGLKPAATINISGSLPPPGALPADSGPGRRGDYQAATAKEAAARAGAAAAREAKWDDPEYGIFYERELTDDAGAGLERENFLGVRLTLPLPLRNKNEGRIYEADAMAARAGAERHAIAERARAEAAAARAEMQLAREIIERASGALLARAREVEERHIEANKLGQAPLSDVIRARTMRFSLDEARLSALRDYHLARVRLLSALGR